ncbi:hypothetical protein J6590_017606 [Homalodisca vitripennis]|nr:hypothetical protein J6590_017606 [Homalodisca vitripennis]
MKLKRKAAEDSLTSEVKSVTYRERSPRETALLLPLTINNNSIAVWNSQQALSNSSLGYEWLISSKLRLISEVYKNMTVQRSSAQEEATLDFA